MNVADEIRSQWSVAEREQIIAAALRWRDAHLAVRALTDEAPAAVWQAARDAREESCVQLAVAVDMHRSDKGC